MEQIDYIINDEKTKVLVIRNWLTHKYAKELHNYFNEHINWVSKQRNFKNKWIPLKRSISIYGDGTIDTYPYHKLPYTIYNWDNNLLVSKEIKYIKDQLNNLIIQPKNTLNIDTININSCIINKYENGYLSNISVVIYFLRVVSIVP